MRFKTTFATLISMITTAAQAHPGHPAASLAHSHTFFGIDPIYTLLLAAAGIAGMTLLWAHRRRVMSKAR